MKTFFASPERSSQEVIDQQFNSLMTNTYLSELVNALPYVVTILNSNRQIVFSNLALAKSLKVSDLRELLGKRPGEALNCIHSRTMEEGCGTSESCRVCGAVSAITTSIKENRKVVNECRIISDNSGIDEYFDFEVTATPFSWQGQLYTIFAIADISGIKRKQMLEKIFFHDIMNTAGNLKGLSDLIMQMDDPGRKDELLKLLHSLSNELVEEIHEQRQLSAAESGDLQLNKSQFSTMEVIESIVDQFRGQNNQSIGFAIDNASENLTLFTDKAILRRILKNMTKNAMEASSEGDIITLRSSLELNRVRFTVHNPRTIPASVQLQIFKRNFSTKSPNRGLGTYSMKLLGERYLKGKVSFSSDDRTGTEFYFDLPDIE